MPNPPPADVFDETAADYDADGSHAELADRLVGLAAECVGRQNPRVVLDVVRRR